MRRILKCLSVAALAISLTMTAPLAELQTKLFGGNDIENLQELEGNVTYDINVSTPIGTSGHWTLEGYFSRTQIGTAPGTHVYTYDTSINALYTFNPEDTFRFALFGGLGPGWVDGIEEDQANYLQGNIGLETAWRLNPEIAFVFRSSLSDRFKQLGGLYDQTGVDSDPVWDNVIGIAFLNGQ